MLDQENLRIKELIDFNILEADLTDILNDFVKQAATFCKSPYAFISVIHSNTQWIKAQVGFEETVIDNKGVISAHTISHSNFFQINDILADKRLENQAYVINELQTRFYASAPLISSNGYVLGALCVMDTEPNQLNEVQISFLNLLAQNAIAQLELRKKSFELEKMQELYELIIETNPDIIFAKDKNFKIIHANSAFMELYPKESRNKIIGYTTLEGYQDEEAEAFLAQDKLAFETGVSELTEKILFPTGEIKTLNTTKTRFKNANGEDYILGVSRDVTEHENLIELLQKSNDDLDEFAYIASHDLKAPLNAIKGLVEWIEEDDSEKLDNDSLMHFGMIKNRVARMRRLLDDLLSYSKIGRTDDEIQTMNLREVAIDCYDLLDIPKSFIINTDKINITLPKIPLEMVLTNLISNAIKHHDKIQGTIDIKCTEQFGSYEITVADDGPGIAKQFHEKIFKRFSKLKSRDEVEGSGLGLSMVEKTINHYAGTIELESDVDKGCKFIIRWPKAKITEPLKIVD